jgi:hypothetical protein
MVEWYALFIHASLNSVFRTKKNFVIFLFLSFLNNHLHVHHFSNLWKCNEPGLWKQWEFDRSLYIDSDLQYDWIVVNTLNQISHLNQMAMQAQHHRMVDPRLQGIRGVYTTPPGSGVPPRGLTNTPLMNRTLAPGKQGNTQSAYNLNVLGNAVDLQ